MVFSSLKSVSIFSVLNFFVFFLFTQFMHLYHHSRHLNLCFFIHKILIQVLINSIYILSSTQSVLFNLNHVVLNVFFSLFDGVLWNILTFFTSVSREIVRDGENCTFYYMKIVCAVDDLKNNS